MKILKLIALLLLVQANTIFAQTVELDDAQKNKDGIILFCKPKTKLSASTTNEKALLQSILPAGNKFQVQLLRSVKDEKATHNYYQFSIEDIPVFGADYVVHSSNGIISFANGNIPTAANSISIKPALNFDKATAFLNNILLLENSKIKKISFNFTNLGLVWFYDGKILKLAFKIKTVANNSIISGNHIVDANNCKLLYFENDICTTNNNENIPPPNATGTAVTLYSGTQNLITDDNFNGGFRLREMRNGVSILTLNANSQEDFKTITNTATDFWDNDNNWQAAEHGNDRYATDVHWATENVIEYWRTQRNRNSIDGNGLAAKGYVHTSMPLSNNINAVWHPTYNAMFYADGSGAVGPVAAFDVVAHEFGHGVCQYTAGLISGTAESGALNEGFSDIWGAAIEAWAAPTKQRWKIGEDIFFNCLRDLQNPKNPFASEGSHPNTYLGQFWRADGEPHNNSTVLSHWFYLLSQGGSGINDINNTFNVTGIGIDKSANIAYLTEQNLNSNANYATARIVSIEAARQLYGLGSCEEKAVIDAWYAVGVGNIYSAPNLEVSITQLGCNNAIAYINLSSGLTFNWSVSGDLLIDGTSTTKTTTSNYINFTGRQGQPYVTTTTSCGIALKGGGIYSPYQRQISGLYEVYSNGDQVVVSVNTTAFDTYYKWYINGVLDYEGASTSDYCTCYSGAGKNIVCGDNTIRVEVTTCGVTSSSDDVHFSKEGNCGYLRKAPDNSIPSLNANKSIPVNVDLFPNPANNQVTIRLKQLNDSKNSNNINDIREVRVLDKLGTIRKLIRYSINTKSINFDVSALPFDIYYIEVSDGMNKVKIPLSIQKDR